MYRFSRKGQNTLDLKEMKYKIQDNIVNCPTSMSVVLMTMIEGSYLSTRLKNVVIETPCSLEEYAGRFLGHLMTKSVTMILT